jgi:DNA-directed RNA polymerase specialized sigma24 family protein
VPEALRFARFEDAFRALPEPQITRLKNLAWKMAHGLKAFGIDGEDLFQETCRRCVAIKEWPQNVDIIAVFIRTMLSLKLDYWRELKRQKKTNDAFEDWQAVCRQSSSQCTPEQELADKQLLADVLSRLKGDPRKVADGRMRGLKGEELIYWCRIAQSRYDNACQFLLRLRNKMNNEYGARDLYGYEHDDEHQGCAPLDEHVEHALKEQESRKKPTAQIIPLRPTLKRTPASSAVAGAAGARTKIQNVQRTSAWVAVAVATAASVMLCIIVSPYVYSESSKPLVDQLAKGYGHKATDDRDKGGLRGR